jgi:hyperosmotically inducible periplasmic protein
MNNSKTPKIVVGVGLIAAYTALTFYMLRDKPDSNLSQDTMAQATDAFVPPPAIPPASTDISTSEAGQAAAETGAPVEAPVAVARTTVNSVAAPTPQTQRVAAKAQGQEPAIARERPIASVSADPTPAAAEVEKSSLTSEVASLGDEPASPAGETAPSVQAEAASSGNDSQITAEVKTQIAAVAPASTIEVTTTDGVVELSGSVPSHEEINKVLLAARNVEHVRSVDASAVMVSN